MLVRGDTLLGADRPFTVSALAENSSTPFGTPCYGTIIADDNGFSISATTISVREGTGQIQYALFDVTRWGDTSQTRA